MVGPPRAHGLRWWMSHAQGGAVHPSNLQCRSRAMTALASPGETALVLRPTSIGSGAAFGDDAGDVGVHGQPASLVTADDGARGEGGGAAGAGFEDFEIDEDDHVRASDAAGGGLSGVVEEVAGEGHQPA